MKKILTVSLFAVMAVSAAHAEIASTTYVGKQIADFNTSTVKPLGDKVGSATFTDAKIVKDAANVTAAVTALDAKLSEVASGSGLTLGADAVNSGNIVDGAVALVDLNDDVTTAIADARQAGTDASAALTAHITDAGNTYETKEDAASKLNEAKQYAAGLASNYDASGSAAQALEDAKDYADSLASSYDGAGSAATAESNAKKYTDDKVKTLNGVTGSVSADGNYVVQTTEANGIVTVSRQAFDTSISNDDNAEHSTVTAPTTKAVATYVADQIGTVATQTNSVQEKLDQIYKRTGSEATGYEETGVLPDIQKDLQDQIDAINDAENGVLADAKSDTDAKIAGLDATVAVEANSNKFVTGVVEVDGKLTSVQSSTINAAVVALANVPEACAAGGQKKCTLSVQDGDFSWEVIEP